MISIIMPVYKAEKYLERSITSVLNQTYSDFELLIIDDGSPDNSGAICDEWAKKDNRIKVFHKANGGTSDARNYGVEKAQGDYITFIDNDDYVLPNWLNDMYSIAKTTDADIVKGGVYLVPDTDVSVNINELFNSVYPESIVKFTNKSISSHNFSQSLIHELGFRCVWNQIVKSEIFKKSKFPVGHLSEDYNVFFDILNYAKKIYLTESIGYCWVQRKNSQYTSMSNNYMADIISDYLLHSDILLKKYHDEVYSNMALKRALETFFYYLAGTPRIKTVNSQFLFPLWVKIQQACKKTNIKNIVPKVLYLQYTLCCISLPLYLKLVLIKARFTK